MKLKKQKRTKKRKITKTFSFSGKPYMNDPRYFTLEDRKHLRFMHPDVYIAKCSVILGMSIDAIKHTRLKDHTSYAYIKKAADAGTLTIPVLDYKNGIQDGLHRAMWCKEQGMKKIPVFIYM